MKDASVYLNHILECVRRIEENTSQGRESLLSSHTLQDAVLRNLRTLSESAQRLPESMKAKHPEIEWRRMQPSAISWFTTIRVLMWKEFGKLFSGTYLH